MWEKKVNGKKKLEMAYIYFYWNLNIAPYKINESNGRRWDKNFITLYTQII